MHDQQHPQKRVVMVLGMARCGTSTIARGLQAIGVNLGSHLHQPDERNPKGFWEDEDVTFKINRGILRELNCHWICDDLAGQLQQSGNHQLDQFKRYALDLVHTRLADRVSWGFKDTNTTVLLPFWQRVLKDAEVDDSYVLALRNPLGCAYSNIKHSKMDLELSLLAWLKCMVLAIEGTHGKKRVIISYDHLLQDPLRELLRMAHHLDFAVTHPAELEHYANHFVDKKLHHHAYSENDLVTHPAMAVVPLCYRVYQLLLRVASDALTFTDPAFGAEWQVIQQEFEKISPLYEFVSAVSTENRELERRLRTIHKSIPWRLLSPLFWLDEALRQRRIHARREKRWVNAWNKT